MLVVLVRRSCRYHRLASPPRLLVPNETGALNLGLGRLLMNTSCTDVLDDRIVFFG